jgi:hypothetical protein
LASWEQVQADPSQDPNCLPILRAEIWHYLTVKLSSNRTFADAPRGFRWQAVEREIQREHWAEMPLEAAQTDPFGINSPRSGRKRKWRDNAERQRAYRQRKRYEVKT